jgi:hypothetical protein
MQQGCHVPSAGQPRQMAMQLQAWETSHEHLAAPLPCFCAALPHQEGTHQRHKNGLCQGSIMEPGVLGHIPDASTKDQGWGEQA